LVVPGQAPNVCLRLDLHLKPFVCHCLDAEFHDVVPFAPLTSIDVRAKWLDYAALVFPLLDVRSAKRIVHLWNLSILQEPCTEQFLLHTMEFIRKSLEHFPSLSDDVWHLVGNMVHFNPGMMEEIWRDMLVFVRKGMSPENQPCMMMPFAPSMPLICLSIISNMSYVSYHTHCIHRMQRLVIFNTT
jgi:hypothetical protein